MSSIVSHATLVSAIVDGEFVCIVDKAEKFGAGACRSCGNCGNAENTADERKADMTEDDGLAGDWWRGEVLPSGASVMLLLPVTPGTHESNARAGPLRQSDSD